MTSELLSCIFTTAEFKNQGINSNQLFRMRQRGELVKIAHGIYMNSETALTIKQDSRKTALAQHIAYLKTAPHSVLSHESAALWYGAPLLHMPQKVSISVSSHQNNSGKYLKVYRNRELICNESVEHRGFRLTSPVQTIEDCAVALPVDDALVIANYFLYQSLCSLDDVRRALAKPRRYHLAKATKVSERLSSLCESPLETLTWSVLISQKVELPQQQFWIPGTAYRADFAWEHLKLILEVDGERKYSGEFGDPVEAIRGERRRQRYAEQLGWTFIRSDWKEVTKRPHELIKRLKAAGVKVEATGQKSR